MRKVSKVSIVVFMVLLLCVGCGSKEEKPDAVSQKMIDDINAIGEVTLDDEDNINKLLNTYNTLTERQKESVNNYATLLEAQDSIDKIKKDKEEAEKAELEEKLNEIHMKYAILGAKKIKEDLINPDSFKLKEVRYCDSKEQKDYFLIEITFSGENKMGGSTEDTAYVDFDDEKIYVYYKDSKYYSTCTYMMSGMLGFDEKYEKPVRMDESFISEHLDD